MRYWMLNSSDWFYIDYLKFIQIDDLLMFNFVGCSRVWLSVHRFFDMYFSSDNYSMNLSLCNSIFAQKIRWAHYGNFFGLYHLTKRWQVFLYSLIDSSTVLSEEQLKSFQIHFFFSETIFLLYNFDSRSIEARITFHILKNRWLFPLQFATFILICQR